MAPSTAGKNECTGAAVWIPGGKTAGANRAGSRTPNQLSTTRRCSIPVAPGTRPAPWPVAITTLSATVSPSTVWSTTRPRRLPMPTTVNALPDGRPGRGPPRRARG
ncbi:hypothetical protein, partial [Pseudonocardia sp. ICBG162]|uniref:hypothetical protein n=1 Tax=Pseudonocardia sp. ICBG162 TaxID=2846761 RepID=UPI001CF6E8D8